MNLSPTVSVIVLCYNQEHTISRTIDSILNQNLSYSYEIIIGEDNSPNDNTREICEFYSEKYPEIVRLLPKSANKGLLKNYSDCLELSKGKYIATCAGDDWWHNSNKLQLQIDFLENNNDYGVSFTNYRLFVKDDINNLPIFRSRPNISINEDNYYQELLKGNFICAATVVFRYDLFKKHISFNEYSKRGFMMEDYPMWLELINHAKFKYLPIETVTYSVSESSISNNPNESLKIEDFENSVLLIKKHFLEKYPVNEDFKKEIIVLHYRNLIRMLIKYKHFDRAKHFSTLVLNYGIRTVLIFIICHTALNKFYSKYINFLDNGNG